MTPRASVSVVVPVHNGEQYLAEALDSIASQTRQVTEVIVVDDGSEDRSAEIAASFGSLVRVVRQTNQGTGASRNHGVHLARGSLIAFLDQDDVWEPQKIEQQVDVIASRPEVAAVFCHLRQFHSPDTKRDFRERYGADDTQVPGMLPSALLVRRSVFDAVGLFNPDLILTEWFEWCVRLRHSDTVQVVLDDVLVHRRVHSANKGVVMGDARHEYATVIRQSLDRRRRQE